MNEMIQTKDLCFEYQGEEQNTQVLKQMNLSIRKGEFIAVFRAQWFWKIHPCQTL